MVIAEEATSRTIETLLANNYIDKKKKSKIH